MTMILLDNRETSCQPALVTLKTSSGFNPIRADRVIFSNGSAGIFLSCFFRVIFSREPEERSLQTVLELDLKRRQENMHQNIPFTISNRNASINSVGMEALVIFSAVKQFCPPRAWL